MTRSAKAKAPRSSRRVCILVVGVHRSGTSAFARVLSLLGCDLPKTLMGANKTNEAGHWESTPICRLNDRILDSAGTKWDDWLEFNPGWLKSPKAEEFRGEVLALLQEEFGASRLFVLKDPRICRLLPFWLDVLEEAGARPLIVSPVRNPLEVAASLEGRNGFQPGLGHLLWLRHVLDAEFASRGTPRIFTSYDRLISGWARMAASAQSTLDIAWPRMSDQAAAEIEAFLSGKYRHHHEAVETVLENPTLSSWVRGAFEILNDWAAAGEKPEDLAALDRIRAELNAAAPAFSRLIAVGQEAAEKKGHLERTLAETQARLGNAEQATAVEREKAARLDSELGTARRRLGEAEQQVARLKADLESQAGAARAADKALAETEARLVKAEQATAVEREKAARLDSELGAARRRLGETEQQVARLKADLESQAVAARAADKALAETQAKLGDAAQAMAAEQEKTDRLERELGTARQRLGDTEQKIAQLHAELERQAHAAEQAERLFTEARHQLAQTESALAQRRHEAEHTAAELAAARQELRQTAAARTEAEKVSAGLKEHVVLLMSDLKERQAAFVALQQTHGTELTRKDEAFATAARQVKEAKESLDAQVRVTAQQRAKHSAELKKARAEADLAKAKSRQLEAQLKQHLDQIAAGQAELDRVRQMSTRQLGQAIAKLLDEHGGRVLWGGLRVKRQLNLLKRSGLFDAEWYLHHYTDVAKAGVDPLRHFVQFGAKEGRAPNAALAHANGKAEPEAHNGAAPEPEPGLTDAARKSEPEEPAVADAPRQNA